LGILPRDWGILPQLVTMTAHLTTCCGWKPQPRSQLPTAAKNVTWPCIALLLAMISSSIALMLVSVAPAPPPTVNAA